MVKLYHYSKGLFVILVTFLLIFFYINYKWGVVATPIYQYGMYSSKLYTGDAYPAYTFEVNGKAIVLSKLPFPIRDQLIAGLERYLILEKINLKTIDALSPLYGYSQIDNDILAGRISSEVFSKWYEQWVGSIVGEQVNTLMVYKSMVSWDNGLKFISSPEKIYPIVP